MSMLSIGPLTVHVPVPDLVSSRLLTPAAAEAGAAASS